MRVLTSQDDPYMERPVVYFDKFWHRWAQVRRFVEPDPSPLLRLQTAALLVSVRR